MAKLHNSIWWGPPKKFSLHVAERKISWLELFYDLVYVIVISKTTHYLKEHPDLFGVIDYSCLFTMIFWGWYNGSMYHDLHGTPGIRTRFMTLWQMMAVGALAVTMDSPSESLLHRATYALLFLQLFITYLWWSVGIYDRAHRKLNVPYTVCYLVAAALLIATFWIPLPYRRFVFWIALIINFLPFILTARRLERNKAELNLSPNMTERLGLLAIIVFGEAILGVINSISHFAEYNTMVWLCFGLGILIVFALWWIFFSVVADRECKEGVQAGNNMSLTYIPTLASLGMVSTAFPALLEKLGGAEETHHAGALHIIYGTSIALFLLCIVALSRWLVYSLEYQKSKKYVQVASVIIGLVNLVLMLLFPALHVGLYLLLVFVSLLVIVVLMTRTWFRIELKRLSEE